MYNLEFNMVSNYFFDGFEDLMFNNILSNWVKSSVRGYEDIHVVKKSDYSFDKTKTLEENTLEFCDHSRTVKRNELEYIAFNRRKEYEAFSLTVHFEASSYRGLLNIRLGDLDYKKFKNKRDLKQFVKNLTGTEAFAYIGMNILDELGRPIGKIKIKESRVYKKKPKFLSNKYQAIGRKVDVIYATKIDID